MNDDGHVSQRRLASALGVTPREVYNLRQKGLPKRVRAGKIDYPLDECVQWYLRFREEAFKTKSTGKQRREELSNREQEIDLALKEIALERERSNVVTLDYMDQQLSGALQRLRAKILAIPGRYAPQIVGLRSLAEAQQRLETLSQEVMISLSETGEDEELYADADPPASEAA